MSYLFIKFSAHTGNFSFKSMNNPVPWTQVTFRIRLDTLSPEQQRLLSVRIAVHDFLQVRLTRCANICHLSPNEPMKRHN